MSNSIPKRIREQSPSHEILSDDDSGSNNMPTKKPRTDTSTPQQEDKWVSAVPKFQSSGFRLLTSSTVTQVRQHPQSSDRISGTIRQAQTTDELWRYLVPEAVIEMPVQSANTTRCHLVSTKIFKKSTQKYYVTAISKA